MLADIEYDKLRASYIENEMNYCFGGGVEIVKTRIDPVKREMEFIINIPGALSRQQLSKWGVQDPRSLPRVKLPSDSGEQRHQTVISAGKFPGYVGAVLAFLQKVKDSEIKIGYADCREDNFIFMVSSKVSRAGFAALGIPPDSISRNDADGVSYITIPVVAVCQRSEAVGTLVLQQKTNAQAETPREILQPPQPRRFLNAEPTRIMPPAPGK